MLVACPFVTAITTVANSIIDVSTRDPRRRTFTEKEEAIYVVSDDFPKDKTFSFPLFEVEPKAVLSSSLVLVLLSKGYG